SCIGGFCSSIQMTVSSHRNVLKLLTLGLIFHVVFIASVFDCYFTSPVVHGILPCRAGSGEEKWIVLIVGDGLCADLLFVPCLHDIIRTQGVFGLLHT
ncbi:uncharacterized protein HD556DRAFT_1340704, partial [Suillus plorans]